MKWENLKSMKCPKCGDLLRREDKYYVCPHNGREFIIAKEKFDSLVNKIYQRPQARYHEGNNQSDLNNLGHEKVAEDFSDSPFLDY